jgi:hypothetical protein
MLTHQHASAGEADADGDEVVGANVKVGVEIWTSAEGTETGEFVSAFECDSGPM